MSPDSGSALYMLCDLWISGSYLSSLRLSFFLEWRWHFLWLLRRLNKIMWRWICLGPNRLSQNDASFPPYVWSCQEAGVKSMCAVISCVQGMSQQKGSSCTSDGRYQWTLSCQLCIVPYLIPVFPLSSAGHSGHGEHAPARVHHCPRKGGGQQRSRTCFSPLPQENLIL